MKKRHLIIGISVISLLVMSVCVLVIITNINKKKNDEKLIKQIFGINVNKYKVLEKQNTLSNTRYGGDGAYLLRIKVESKQMDNFISEIGKEQYVLMESEEFEEKSIYYKTVSKNISGWNDDNIESIYCYIGSPKRSIKSTVTVMSSEGWIIIRKSNVDAFEVCLWYYG